MARFFVIVLLTLFSGVLCSAVYRWTDADGKVHFTDRPVENAEQMRLKVSPITVRPPAKLAVERKQLQQRLLDVFREEREEREKRRNEQKIERKKSKQKCLKAKSELVKYRDSRAIYSTTDRGEREYYSLERRKKYIEHLKSRVAKWCG
ncbi:MAG: DUF4124 domain-containing protein [Candidatus Polarisedimenticolaceae bacterium]|nr:DUF4124 domain-containing protein [Candidatus Polarisedimenticolaceae bacterium]